MSLRILSLVIMAELDVVAARQRARQISALCGFAAQDQARIATAVSELARNIYNYAGRGTLAFALEGDTAPQLLTIDISDSGPGIPHLDVVLSGSYASPTGMGVGLLGAKRLMDRFDITTGRTGTTIVLKKLLPPGAPLLTPAMIGRMGGQLAALSSDVTLSEVQQQNKELLGALDELRARQEELLALTRELEDTNRGVVALYAELDEKADHLRRADEMKSRFLSNMSHEFRTPLSSIRALSRLLIEGMDGQLNEEQEKQVRFILKGAESLTELVDDLLDIAKIEAGKVEVRVEQFDVGELFSALRGMLRPLLVSDKVDLSFELPAAPLSLTTDEAKVSQILRNFISNALKFTETGSVRVAVRALPDEGAVRFSVTDTGVGIAGQNLQLIFEEFSQVANGLQERAKGTGLGLPLCRQLAQLLGGSVAVTSALGVGSEFSLTIPVDNPASAAPEVPDESEPQAESQQDRIPLLVVEDDAVMLGLYTTYFRDTPFRMIAARSIWEAEQALRTERPVAVILDLYLNGEDTWRWLSDFKRDNERKDIPVLIVSDVNDPAKGFGLGANGYLTKPVTHAMLMSELHALCQLDSGS